MKTTDRTSLHESGHPASRPEEFLISLAIDIPVAMPGFFPQGNLSGTLLLGQLLEAILPLANLGGPNCICGELNCCLGIWEVTDLGGAFAAIKGVLSKVVLLDSARIAYWDPRENIWRNLYPPKAQDWTQTFVKQRLAVVRDDNEKLIALLREAQSMLAEKLAREDVNPT